MDELNGMLPSLVSMTLKAGIEDRIDDPVFMRSIFRDAVHWDAEAKSAGAVWVRSGVEVASSWLSNEHFDSRLQSLGYKSEGIILPGEIGLRTRVASASFSFRHPTADQCINYRVLEAALSDVFSKGASSIVPPGQSFVLTRSADGYAGIEIEKPDFDGCLDRVSIYKLKSF